MAVATRARTLGDTMKLRSGLKEGWEVSLRHRKPMDPLELHDWIAQDIAPLNAALSAIWTRDDQEGVRLANDVVNKCANLLGVSGARQPADGWERLWRWASGERWTPEMTKAYDDAMHGLAHARKRYADHVRVRFGLDAVKLFTSVQAGDMPNAVEEGASPSSKTLAAADGDI